MISRSDASASFPSGLLPDGDRDLLVINGHQFALDAPTAPFTGGLA